MILEVLLGLWILEPFAQELDNCNYECEIMQDEIEDLKEEIRLLKSDRKYY
ncbi:hypothetical protein II906_00565 [bacterium]|nr:hypothetical protein [bacterium]